MQSINVSSDNFNGTVYTGIGESQCEYMASAHQTIPLGQHFPR